MSRMRMVLIVEFDEHKVKLAALPEQMVTALEAGSGGLVEVPYAYLLDDNDAQLVDLIVQLEKGSLDLQEYLKETRSNAQVIRLDDRRSRRKGVE